MFIDYSFGILVHKSPYLKQQIKSENYKIYKLIYLIFHIWRLYDCEIQSLSSRFMTPYTLASVYQGRDRISCLKYSADCGDTFIRN